MPDCVVDATVVHLANGDIAGRRPGNVLDRRLAVIERVGRGISRLRYNPKLLGEYRQLVEGPDAYRNDAIELFFTALTERAFFVPRNTLSRQDYATAKECGWPGHDKHLLAAAIGGDDSTVFVTERRLAQCADHVLRRFAVHIEHLG